MPKQSTGPTAGLALVAFAVSLAGCGQDAGDDAPSSEVSNTVETASEQPLALPRTAAPDSARVWFVSPADGETVSDPVVIEFGAEGISVVRAGVDAPQSGHHHLIIDAELPDLSLPIPASDHYVHFGDASTKTERTLGPGTHTLQLLLGDYRHVPHDPPVMSGVVTITVE